jgi:sRNA-binding regulator protein Hfq
MREEGMESMGKKKAGGFGPMKIFEQEIMKIRNRLRKIEEQVNAMRDLTWVAADLLNELGGKKVKLKSIDGSTLSGTLESYDRFNLKIKTDKGKSFVVMKHAIASIEPV